MKNRRRHDWKKTVTDLLTLGMLAVAGVALAVLMGAAAMGCYPKDCDPRTDPLKCQCPPGPCGDMSARDAGGDQ